jgi:sialic acid synthase SpsE
VDFIKLQTYFADTLVEKTIAPDRWAHFKKFELSIDQHIELAELVTNQGKNYLTSIWDIDSYIHLEKYLTHVKIGSGDAVAYSFLEQAALIGKPIILSTGLCTFNEVSSSIAIIREINPVYKAPEFLYVLQCTSMYPIPMTEANLNVMSKYRNFNCRVGYSDHTLGKFALEVAALRGAEMLEFHFTDDKENMSFRDHQVSLVSEDIEELNTFFDSVYEICGSNEKKPTQSEHDNDHIQTFRRGTYLQRNLSSGSVISKDDLIEKRPLNNGLSYSELIGKKVNRDLNIGQFVLERDVYE